MHPLEDAPQFIEGRTSQGGFQEGAQIKVERITTDRYGRTVCRIYIDGHDLNRMMVEDGYAWAFRKYLQDRDREVYVEAEDRARRERRGLWAGGNPVPPWDFRRQKAN